MFFLFQNSIQSARDSIPNLSIPLAVVVPKNRLPPPHTHTVHSETVNAKNTAQYTVTERTVWKKQYTV